MKTYVAIIDYDRIWSVSTNSKDLRGMGNSIRVLNNKIDVIKMIFVDERGCEKLIYCQGRRDDY